MKKTSVNPAVMGLLCSLANRNGFSFYLEHVAIAATGSLPRIQTGLKASGFQIKKEGSKDGKPFFLQHDTEPNMRIEVLTDPEVPGHEAFRIMGTLDDYRGVITSFRIHHGYELLEQSVETKEIKAEMFRQTKTGAVFQIIHRSDESVFFDEDDAFYEF